MRRLVTAVLILARHQIAIDRGVRGEEVAPSMLGLVDRADFSQLGFRMFWSDRDAKGIDLAIGHARNASTFYQRLSVFILGADQTESTMADGSENLAFSIRLCDHFGQFVTLSQVVARALVRVAWSTRHRVRRFS